MKQHRSTEQIIGELLAGPKYPDREFTRCGTSFPQVYALAADQLDMFAQTDTQNKPICLATHDKAVI
ncbi:hypothetical protein VU11_07585, partial [Desulfobulbus sp. US2]|nr:hypothetical protein [Desulfobulbus sp. US2]